MKILCASQTGSATIMGQTMRIIAVAKALQRRGHAVQYLAGEALRKVLDDQGLPVLPLPEMPSMDFLPTHDLLAKDPQYREEYFAAFKRSLNLTAAAEKEAVRNEKPDLLLSGSLLSPLTARMAGIPCVMSFLQPHGPKTWQFLTQRMTQRTEQPPAQPTDQPPSSPGLAGIDYREYFQEFLRNYDPELAGTDDWRGLIRRVLEAVPLLLIEGMPEIDGGTDFATALGEWGDLVRDKIRYTGPLLPEDPADLPVQEELKLRHAGRKDRPLVYVSIGGGSSLIGEEFLKTVLEMFRKLPGVSGVIATGLAIAPEKLAAHQPPQNVAVRGFVPGLELIKACDVAVFHGGSSTLMTCIACGRPAVVIPSMAEQEDNGAVLSQNGAGLVLAKDGLNAAVLAEAVQTISADRFFLAQAQKLKEVGAKYGGATGAAVAIEKAVSGRYVGAGVDTGSR